MKQRVMKRFQPPGTAPGTLPPPAESAAGPVSLSLVTYDEGSFQERTLERVGDAPGLVPAGSRGWLRIFGHDTAVLTQLTERFGVHPLVLEDALNLGQHPKVEEYDAYVFVIVDAIRRADHGYQEEQVSLLLFDNLLISIHERAGDLFRGVEERLRSGRARIRTMGLDHLAYALVDTVVDHYFPALEGIGDRLEEIESSLLESPDQEDLQALHVVKRDLLRLRKATWPLREMVAALSRGDSRMVGKETRLYLRDVSDHTVQIMEILETYREMAMSLTDMYVSSMSNRLNSIMKVLTVIATIFMPLSFLAGVWGMNFNPEKGPLNMPELNWAWGYPSALAFMALVALGMLLLFKRRGWF